MSITEHRLAPPAPTADRQPVVDDVHGYRVPDPYRWLEDPADAATVRWSRAQDQHWRAHAARWPERKAWRAAVAGFSGVGVVTAPRWRGGRTFFLRQRAGQEHPVLYTESGGVERVLVDPTAVDPTGLTTLDGWQPDPGGRLLAYQLSAQGSEDSRLFVLDIDSREPVGEPIGGCRYSPVAWLPDGDAFYYVRAGCGVYLHRMGSGSADDVPVPVPASETASYGIETSADGRWLVIAASRNPLPGNDLWLIDRAADETRVVQRDLPVAAAASVGRDGRLYLHTDGNAPTGRLLTADPEDPALACTELLPADPGAVLRDIAILDGPELDRPLLLAFRVRHAIGEIGVHDLATGEPLDTVPLPGAGTVGSPSTRQDAAHEAWFTYTDTVTPATVYRYDGRTGQCARWVAPPGAARVLPGIQHHQLMATSADGTPIRVVLTAGPCPAGRPRPTILYGYGGFGVPLVPSYSGYSLAWVRAGGVFATAQLRGGSEEGEQWHRAGMGEGRQRVFDDFIAAAEALIATGWTTADRLGICGESNGGLTVGAALTQRPELFAAAVCSAPLLDMVRYERSGLGAHWRGEYGSAADPEQLAWLLGYSPYHRVRQGVRYPAVLFTVFGGDTRVDPLHANKMCAALQWASTGDGPILLRRTRNAGHGAQAASGAVDLAGDMLAFLAAHTGLSTVDTT